ncbi:MAG: hypothetical protein R2820_13930 [Cyclobacteriaceae bacterium]|nr:hypothetical protein [Cyclobacteriaceae bacterium]
MRYLIAFSMMIVVLTACRAQPKDEIKLLPEAKRPKMAPDLVEALSTEPFTLKNTAKLASYLMNENHSFQNIVRVYAFGGVYEADYFQINSPNNAIRFWYCYNPTNSDYPTFFLALEQINADDSTEKDPENSPAIGDTLMVPTVFTYNKTSTHYTEIQNFIQEDTSVGKAKKISRQDVLDFAENFRSLLSIISPNGIGPYSKYMVSIFEKNPSYDEFLNRNGGLTHIRYYLGLSHDIDHEPNWLRPVLAGVDAQRRTVYNRANLNVGTFLQKSFPPPPYNN